jgi:cobalt-zinc-cadmium efflux system protein
VPVNSHEHETHGHGETSSQKKLGVVTGINVVGFLIELAGGLLFGSVALMSDAIHMLFDASAYATAFAAAYIAENMEASDRWTYGFHRIEVVSALINGVLLIPMAGWIVWEAYQRFLSPVTIDIGYTLVIATGGLIVNIASVYYLHGDEEMSLNERGAFYHLLGDAAGSLAVIFGLLVIAATGIKAVDPIAAVLIAGLVVWSAGKVLLEGTGIILQKSPIDPDELKEHVMTVDGVDDAHDIRCWRVCSSVNVCTIHATMSVETLEEAEQLREELDERLKDRFDLQHVTIQIETK